MHTNSIFRKLGVTNRLQAVLAWQRERPKFRDLPS
jgi:DNA-binding CsgD family transcriptional regulator